MNFLNGIHTILFDLGGVLLNINPQKTIEAFGQLGMEQLIGYKGLTYDHEIFYLMEQGKVTPDEFRNGVRKLLPIQVTDQQIDSAWTAMLIDFPAIRVQLLQNLAKEFDLYLFSNTNAIHVEKYFDIFRQEHGFEVATLFKQVFHSNEVGYRKPSAESFKEIIRLSGVCPEETLFIDDSMHNVEGAMACGLKGYWLQPGQTVEELFREYVRSRGK